MKFDVETGQLNTMVQSFQESLTQISGNRERMYQALEALDGMWKGQSHDAFVAQYSADNEKMVALIKDLQQLAENMGKARQSYDTCEQEVKSAIASIQI